MATKDIVGLLTLHDRNGNVIHQGSNISFRYAARYRTIYRWNNNYGGSDPYIGHVPWKMAGLIADDAVNIGHDVFLRGPSVNYPADPTGTAVAMGDTQFGVFRNSGTVGTVSSSSVPRVFGSVVGYSAFPGVFYGYFGRGDSVISQVDVPLDYTQIGIVYIHPAHQQATTVTTSAGLNYVTYTNGSFWDQLWIGPGVFNIIRIESGSDAGYYFVQHQDTVNDRLYLRCLNGQPFRAIGSASVLATAAPGRRAWFNEVSVIPLSVGTVETSGRYNPRSAALGGHPALRDSFILRLTIEKTGSTEAASGTEQQGSYLMSLLPFTHGDGALSGSTPDSRGLGENYIYGMIGSDTLPSWWVHFTGAVNGIALDWENQRLWFGLTDSSNQSALYHWRYKTTESFREVANYLGTAGSASFLNPTPVLGAGDIITHIETGSSTGSAKNWVYVSIYHASGGNGGILIIKPDLTTLQYTTATGVPASTVSGCVLDKTRTRVGTTGDVSTNTSNNVTTASGNFTASDIGRVIKLTGLGPDSGTYLISTVGGATTVGVTTLSGGAVTFTSQTGGTYEIGDRLYLFFNDGTTGAGKINYMESMAPGTFLTRTVSMTNGATINTRVAGASGLIYGQPAMCSIDKANGNVYWLSNDTQQQVNKYDPLTNTHEFIPISNTTLLSPPGGVVVGGANPATNPGTPTLFTAIHVNSKFDDVWVGSNAGHFRFSKSLPLLSNGTGDTIGGTAPNMTLTDAAGNFTPAHAGRRIIISGATTAANNGIFTITSYTSPTQIGYTNANGVAEAFSGTWQVENIRRYYGTQTTTYHSGSIWKTGAGNGTSGISGTAPNMTLNSAGTPFAATDVGKYLIITGASTAANNGVFRITAFNSSSSISYTNSSGAAQANYAGTWYIVNGYAQRGNGAYGTTYTSQYTRQFMEAPDGRMYMSSRDDATTSTAYGWYSQEADAWSPRWNESPPSSGVRRFLFDPYGRWFSIYPGVTSSVHRYAIGAVEVEHQWDNANSKWVPREWVRTSMPNKSLADTTSPYAVGRPIHSTYEDVIFGAKVRWNRQGGATPPNNEFLGRGGQSRTTATDGSTTAGSSTFGGSSFTSGDVGKLLRIESGGSPPSGDVGLYKISAYINASSVTLQNMDGSAFVAYATQGTLTYTVWDLGTPGANAGPENVTVLLADGFGKDNTQDLGGTSYENFGFKTRFSDNFEGRKFAVSNPLSIPGSTETKVYYETYARAAAQYDPALSHHRALPASEATNGRQLCDWLQERILNGSGSRANLYSSPSNSTIWFGNQADNSVLGCSAMVDFGKNVEVGYILLRLKSYATSAGYAGLGYTSTYNGLIANLYNASDAGGTPQASRTSNGTGDTIGGTAPNMTLTDAAGLFTAADVGRYVTISGATTGANNGTFVISAFNSPTQITYTNASGVAETFTGKWNITPLNVRTSGTLNGSVSGANVTTMTLSSGDFLGPVTAGPFSNGSIVANQSTFTAPALTFASGDRGKILSITAGAGADNGSYRIVSVSIDGSTVTIRNLDQTTKTWTVSASGLTYTVRDGVQEEDMILFVSGTEHRLCVERLLTSTSLQVRTGPNAAISSQSWICLKPTWSHVKRLSYSTEAQPPDVKNNGTWMTYDGRGQKDFNDILCYFDLTDLPSAQRTGRWWKWTGLPRFNTNNTYDNSFHWCTFEFYDPSGNKLGLSRYGLTDEARTNSDFFFSWLNRVDFIQSASDAMAGVTGFNGNANLGGTSGDTVTLTTGGNKFLGFQVRVPYTDGSTTSPDILNSASASWTSADVGRFVRMTSGAYAGNYYRIASRISATQVTLVTPSGGAPGLATNAGPMNFTVHEGINAGGTYPDKFVFRRLGTAGDVTTTAATNQLNSASGNFTGADVGKIIKVTGASNDNGAYLIKTVVSSTQVTVTDVLGGTVSFSGGTGGTFEVDSDAKEYSILTINDSLTTITISETLQPAISNQPWEIRRPGYDTTSTTTEPSKTARITRAANTYPVQSGDITQDRTGHHVCFSEDIGSGYQRADGTIPGGSGVFNGSGFCSDDVGRLLYIDTGTNKGVYEISAFTSATSITVKNHYTGSAVSLTADTGPVTYRVFGDRRFRLSKYCTGLRA